MSLRVLESPAALAEAATARTLEILARAIEARGAASLVLSGGRTPETLYARLAASPGPAGSWGRVGVWFADERAVPPGDPDSNFRMARTLLLEPAGVPPANVHRMEAERPDAEAAARAYEAGFPARADLVLLGVGEDGHTASLFPGSALLAEAVRRIAVVRDSPKPPPVRMTVTPRVLREAADVLVLASGAGKAAAVGRALRSGAPRDTPAALVRDREWLVDRDAAGG